MINRSSLIWKHYAKRRLCIVIFVHFSILYHRKVYDVRHKIEPNFMRIYLSIVLRFYFENNPPKSDAVIADYLVFLKVRVIPAVNPVASIFASNKQDYVKANLKSFSFSSPTFDMSITVSYLGSNGIIFLFSLCNFILLTQFIF